MKLVPDTSGTLFRSKIRRCKSNFTRLDLEVKAEDMFAEVSVPPPPVSGSGGGETESEGGFGGDSFWCLER